jgi:hypothetical protein
MEALLDATPARGDERSKNEQRQQQRQQQFEAERATATATQQALLRIHAAAIKVNALSPKHILS